MLISHVPPVGAPAGPAATRAVNPPSNPLQEMINTSRKRKQAEQEQNQQYLGYDPHYDLADGSGRPMKQTARRGGDVAGNASFGHHMPQNQLPYFMPQPPANFPLPPPGAPPMGLLAMLGAFNPTMALPPTLSLPPYHQFQFPQLPKRPCLNFHEKGICVLGNLCPFEHGNAIAISKDKVPEYDPERSFLAVQPPADAKPLKSNGTESTQTRKGGQPRAEFSLVGPSSDPSNTTLVVEQIPQEHFNDMKLQKFFSQFGVIEEMHMYTIRRLAVIKFKDHESAKRAYNNPLAIFDNRFIKVYWHKSDSELAHGVFDDREMDNDAVEEDKLDLEEVAKRQAAAQTAFEARRKKMQDVDTRVEEVEKKLKAKDDEIKDIKKQLAVLSADELDPSQSLATLQAEAAGLFAEHDGPKPVGRGSGAIPASHRGPSAPLPFGRGSTPLRGGYYARSATFANGRSSVKRLDNRPKRLAISPIEPDSSKDEALRQYLIVSAKYLNCVSRTNDSRTFPIARILTDILKQRILSSSHSKRDIKLRLSVHSFMSFMSALKDF